MKKNKKTNKTDKINEKIKQIRSILDTNYFHTSIEITKDMNIKWTIFYNNLPTNIFFSEKNTVLLSSEKNSIQDIYKLKHKFEREKRSVVKKNIREFNDLAYTVFYFMLKIKRKYTDVSLGLWIPIFISALLNLIFFQNTAFSFLLLCLAIILAVMNVIQEKEIQKESELIMHKVRENFIREKIKRQGIWFVNKLRC